jgi:hypothetical protein
MQDKKFVLSDTEVLAGISEICNGELMLIEQVVSFRMFYRAVSGANSIHIPTDQGNAEDYTTEIHHFLFREPSHSGKTGSEVVAHLL